MFFACDDLTMFSQSRHDLDAVTVVDLIVNGDELPVYSGTDHFIADGAVYTVCEINRGRPRRQILYISCRRKTIHMI